MSHAHCVCSYTTCAETRARNTLFVVRAIKICVLKKFRIYGAHGGFVYHFLYVLKCLCNIDAGFAFLTTTTNLMYVMLNVNTLKHCYVEENSHTNLYVCYVFVTKRWLKVIHYVIRLRFIRSLNVTIAKTIYFT